MKVKKALFWFLFWGSLAAFVNLIIYIFIGQDKAIEFLGAYVLEQSLSVDNLFLFLIIFTNFGVSPSYQRRVLNYGIAGAIILRFLLILAGISIVNKFEWILYIFGFFLIYTGITIILKKEKVSDFKNSSLIKFLNKHLRITPKFEHDKFFVIKNKVLYATPLFAVLILIEASDIVFALDSVPAIFSITTDTFIVYTSNILAILSLRSLYFLLEKASSLFKYVKLGVACILIFTGVKMSLAILGVEISILLSIGIIMFILIMSIAASAISAKLNHAHSFR